MDRASNRQQLEQYLSTIDSLTIHYIIEKTEFSSLNINRTILFENHQKRITLLSHFLIENNAQSRLPISMIIDHIKSLTKESYHHFYLKDINTKDFVLIKYLFYKIVTMDNCDFNMEESRKITNINGMHCHIISRCMHRINFGTNPEVEIKNMISNYYGFRINFDWLSSNNSKLANWASHYISNHTFAEEIISKISDITLNPKDFKTTIAGIIYALNKSDAEKELFHLKMKKAWGQVKYRDKIKQEEKICISIVINNNTKEKLHEISIAQKLNTNSVIEYLISSEWNITNK